MPTRYGSKVWTLTLLVLCCSLGWAQEQHFKLGGGAGFSWPSDPELSLDRGWDLGGFLGFRFNDNLSLETGLSFARSDRQFFGAVLPGGDPADELSDFDVQTTRYHLDGVLVINIGRREPFHPFVLGGAGILREDRKITDLTPLRGITDPSEIENIQLESTKETNYYPVVAFGAGFDFYIFYNVAARFEYRVWTSKDWDRRTQRLFFTAIYFF